MVRKGTLLTLGEVRSIVKRILSEIGGPAMASGTDPMDAKGFYDYDIERGVDVHSFWYRSPGRPAGTEGDPYRPADSLEYLGMKPKVADTEDIGDDASGETGAPRGLEVGGVGPDGTTDDEMPDDDMSDLGSETAKS